jgi:hypothetical protein
MFLAGFFLGFLRSWNLEMGAVRSSETSMDFHLNTRHYVPDDFALNGIQQFSLICRTMKRALRGRAKVETPFKAYITVVLNFC